MKYCVYCGKQIDDNSMVCRYCGNSQPVEDDGLPKTESIAKKKTLSLQSIIIIVSAAVVALAAISVAVFFVLRPKPEKTGESVTDQVVAQAATGILLSHSFKTLSVDESFKLDAVSLPSGDMTDDVTWTSSDESVATVSAGDVKAVADGTAFIFASDPAGNSSVCKVTVGSESAGSSLEGFGDLSTRLVSVSATKPNRNVNVLGGDAPTIAAGEVSVPVLPASMTSTGYIMDNGYVLTTSNIADSNDNLFITMPDGTCSEARLVSNDISRNTAVLEIVGHENLNDSAEVGFTRAETVPVEGDTLYVIGYTTPYQSEPEIKEVTFVGVTEQDGEQMLIVNSEGSNIPGGVVTDSEGNIYGVSMLDIGSSSTSLVLAADNVDRSASEQISRISEGTAVPETINNTDRNNIYLDKAASDYDADINELSKQYDSSSWWSGHAQLPNGMEFTVDQHESEIVRLKFSSPEASYYDYIFSFGSQERSTATAYTDVGEYRYEMNYHSLRPGEQGEVLLYFEGIEGNISRIVIDHVPTVEGEVLEITFDADDTMSEIVGEILTDRRKMITAAYKEKLEEYKDWLNNKDWLTNGEFRGIAFIDITGDGLEEMIVEAAPNEYGACKAYEVYGYAEGKASLLHTAESRFGADAGIYLLPDGIVDFTFQRGQTEGSYSCVRYENGVFTEIEYGIMEYLDNEDFRPIGIDYVLSRNGKEETYSYKYSDHMGIEDPDNTYSEVSMYFHKKHWPDPGYYCEPLTWPEAMAYLDGILN